MGKPVRRLRPLLPRQARGRRQRRDPFHRHRLQAARRQDLPLPRLSAASPAGSRLRQIDPGRGARTELAPGHLRLSAGRRRTGPLRLASARFGFAGQRARGRRLGARPGLGQRDRPCARTLAGPDRQMAEPQAARAALKPPAAGRAPFAMRQQLALLTARQRVSVDGRLDRVPTSGRAAAQASATRRQAGLECREVAQARRSSNHSSRPRLPSFSRHSTTPR